jgi:organic radical activating enzyme
MNQWRNSGNYIPMDELLGYLSKLDLGNVVVSGGEPTMHPDIEILLDYLEKHADKVLLETNGFCIAKIKRHENLTVLMSIYEDESLDDKLEQLYDSVNETYLQTFVNHKDYVRTSAFCKKYGVKEFKSAWNDDKDVLLSMYEPYGNFGHFITPEGTELTCNDEQTIYDTISERTRMEAAKNRKSFGHIIHDCGFCPSGTKYRFIFDNMFNRKDLKNIKNFPREYNYNHRN